MWLQERSLDEYHGSLVGIGVESIDDMCTLVTETELTLDITMPVVHRKKFLKAIKDEKASRSAGLVSISSSDSFLFLTIVCCTLAIVTADS